MDREKYDIVLIGIDKDGRWHLKALADFEEEMEGSLLPHLTSRGMRWFYSGAGQLVNLSTGERLQPVDVVFLFFMDRSVKMVPSRDC